MTNIKDHGEEWQRNNNGKKHIRWNYWVTAFIYLSSLKCYHLIKRTSKFQIRNPINNLYHTYTNPCLASRTCLRFLCVAVLTETSLLNLVLSSFGWKLIPCHLLQNSWWGYQVAKPFYHCNQLLGKSFHQEDLSTNQFPASSKFFEQYIKRAKWCIWKIQTLFI